LRSERGEGRDGRKINRISSVALHWSKGSPPHPGGSAARPSPRGRGWACINVLAVLSARGMLAGCASSKGEGSAGRISSPAPERTRAREEGKGGPDRRGGSRRAPRAAGCSWPRASALENPFGSDRLKRSRAAPLAGLDLCPSCQKAPAEHETLLAHEARGSSPQEGRARPPPRPGGAPRCAVIREAENPETPSCEDGLGAASCPAPRRLRRRPSRTGRLFLAHQEHLSRIFSY
jgi:hypothetical protein